MIEIINYIYLPLLLIPIYSSLRLLIKYWFYIGDNALNPEFLDWDSKTEKARLYLFLIGIILFSAAYFKKIRDTYDLLNYILLISLITICIISNILLLFIWSKKFEDRFSSDKNDIKQNLESDKEVKKIDIKEPLHKSYKSPYYTSELDINKLLDNLPNIKCDPEILKDLFLGNKIPENKKIISSYSKRGVIRFVVIVFDIKEAESHKEIKKIISHYFIQKEKNKQNYSNYNLLDSDTAITFVLKEILNDFNSFLKEKEDVMRAFQIAGHKTE